MNNVDKFKQFLRDNDAAAKFYNNCRIVRPTFSRGLVDRYLVDTEKHICSKVLLSGAFPWSTTAEGYSFWEDLDCKWRSILLQ